MSVFHRELSMLEGTYELACRQSIDRLASLLHRAQGPLLAVGSGSSGTAGQFAASLHERLRGHLSRSATPLDLTAALAELADTHTLLLSFGGRHLDVLDALRSLRARRPRTLVVLCGVGRSPLGEAARAAEVDLVELGLEPIEDGVLGINLLLAFLVVLFRAASEAAGLPSKLPRDLAALVGATSLAAFMDEVHETTATLWERPTTLLLYAPATRVAGA
jgi:fructoselysine-6-P-deglycase FrlB-like protein